jgi:hypothetical protein
LLAVPPERIRHARLHELPRPGPVAGLGADPRERRRATWRPTPPRSSR